jgi:hypothetical protein
MKQVKAAVGEDDAAAVAFVAAKPQNRFLQCKDCRIQRVSMQVQERFKVTSTENLVYHAGKARRPRPATRLDWLAPYR